LLLGALKKPRLGDPLSIEYKIKDEDEPKYQLLSPIHEDK
jgi:hypothetical protein